MQCAVAGTNSCAHIVYHRMRGYALPSVIRVGINACDNLSDKPQGRER
jgi:hypothetical protein